MTPGGDSPVMHDYGRLQPAKTVYRMFEENLIADLKSGKSSALNAVFRQYYARLCLFATRMTKDFTASEDLVGEVFIRFWARHAHFESATNIKAFLYISTRNACLNYIKHQQKKALTHKEMAYLAEESDEYSMRELMRSEILHAVMEEIENLPVQCQKIFKMSYLNGLKNDEIARQLNLSIHTVRNQKQRALQLLRTKLISKDLLQLYLLCFPVCRHLLDS